MNIETCDWCQQTTRDWYLCQTRRQTHDNPAEYEPRCRDCDERDAGLCDKAVDDAIDARRNGDDQ